MDIYVMFGCVTLIMMMVKSAGLRESEMLISYQFVIMSLVVVFLWPLFAFSDVACSYRNRVWDGKRYTEDCWEG